MLPMMGILQHIVTQHTLFMESVNLHRPHRAVIRCKANMLLLETANDYSDSNGSIDEALLKELSKPLFRSKKYQIYFEQGHPKQIVNEVEDQLAQELAETYRSIQKRHQDPFVQHLNSLLSA